MSSSQTRTAVSIAVRDIEKRYQPTRCYKFVLEVTWSDKSRYVIYRSYSEFLELHMVLVDSFPIEAGDIDRENRVLPKLSGTSLFSRNEVYKVADKRRTEVSDYCNRLMALHPRISQFPKLVEFLQARKDDLNIPNKTKVKKSLTLSSIGKKIGNKKKKNRNMKDPEFAITTPLQLQSYTAIADFKASAKGQISIKLGDLVDVIDKNPNGWWYVSSSGIEGWAPATYLDKMNEEETEPDEMPCLAGELYLSVKAYTAKLDDELSFGSFVVLEVLNKILDGWWIASYDDKVGHVPATYLQVYDNPYLQPMRSISLPADIRNSPVLPTPRRQSIRNANSSTTVPVRDLQPYRRATEKRRQRTIKQKKPSDSDFSDMPMCLSLILEGDGDDIYLTPKSSNNPSISVISDDHSYVDPETFANVFVPANKRNSRTSPLSQLVAPPRRDIESRVSDNDGYEPVNSYENPPQKPERALGQDILPPYTAPRLPADIQTDRAHSPQPPACPGNTNKTNGKPNLLQKIVPNSRSTSNTSDDYEVVCDKKTTSSSLPPPPKPAPRKVENPTTSKSSSLTSSGMTPADLNTRIPPPKPSSDKLTRLSKIDSTEYDYVSVELPLNNKSSTSSEVEPPATLASTPSPKVTVPRKQPIAKTTQLSTQQSSSTSPPASQRSEPKPASQNELSSKLKNLKPVNGPKSPPPKSYSSLQTQVKIKPAVEQNNNGGRSSGDGKVYEEILVKPSQLKGKTSAGLRKPK